jgi:hypothetical protein
MPQELVLFVSAGRTDLKLFAAEQDNYCAVEIDKKSTRIFHQWLLDHPEKYIKAMKTCLYTKNL